MNQEHSGESLVTANTIELQVALIAAMQIAGITDLQLSPQDIDEIRRKTSLLVGIDNSTNKLRAQISSMITDIERPSAAPASTTKFHCPEAATHGVSPGGPFKIDGTAEWGKHGHCTYCGSLNPEQFFRILEEKDHVLIPTDKNYKCYVRQGTSGQQKFYFSHLSDEQKQRFIELVNQRRIIFGVPGHFYVMPFFMQLV